jgi:hypothetical protein
MVAGQELRAEVEDERVLRREAVGRSALADCVGRRLRNPRFHGPTDPRAPLVGTVQRARQDERDERAHPRREDRFIRLPAGVKVMSEMRVTRGKVGTAVEQRDERARDRSAAYESDGIVKPPLVFGQLLPPHDG